MTDVDTPPPPPPETEPFPAPPRRRRLWLRILLALAGVVLVVGVVVGVWVSRQLNPPGAPGPEISLTVAPGSSTRHIAELLEEKDVITNARLFRYYVRLKGEGPFQAGQYTFRVRDSMSSVVSLLDDGPEIELIRFTVPEGLWLEQIAERVGRLPGRSAERFLEVANSGVVRSKYQPAGSNNLEGLLLPETYFLDAKADEEAILRRMVDAFDQTATELGYDDAPAKVGLSPYQAIVVASLVEEEAKVDVDRPLVARVIYNRIAKRMKLEIDATVQYALGRHKERLTRSDLEVDSPYNTRRFPGIPPTPIAASGRASLRATLAPADNDYLFYVLTDANGRHSFTADYNEFLRFKAEAERKGLL